MEELISIFCKNNSSVKQYKPGVSLLEIYEDQKITLRSQVLLAKVNNRVQNLSFRVYKPKDVEFVDITDPAGRHAYIHSLFFIMFKAVSELFPGSNISLEHPVSKGYYCELNIGHRLTDAELSAVKIRMQEIIELNIPIDYLQEHTTTVIEHFRNVGAMDKVDLLQTVGSLYTCYYKMGGLIDYYYEGLVPYTGFIYLFDLLPFDNGVLLRIPSSSHPKLLEDVVAQPKMHDVFEEYQRWNEIMGIESVGKFNTSIKEGKASGLIKVSEALHEKKISYMADRIYKKWKEAGTLKFIMISGPSSSGKTTFSKRLGVQLMTNGLVPVALSLDDYFVDRDKTPRDEKGEYNFESIYALDLDLFNKQLKQLVDGEEVELPTYSFETGKRLFKGNKLKVENNTLIIIEGIHALNPELTQLIDQSMKYMIYVSALTTISMDNHNRISTTDNRLLRRILRDHLYRGYSAQETIKRWPSVRAGEDKWIFPYQENADEMFNSALIFELAVIKKYVEPILSEVPQNCVEYSEARRLLHVLSYLSPIYDNEIPPTSLLREFLGGSSFRY